MTLAILVLAAAYVVLSVLLWLTEARPIHLPGFENRTAGFKRWRDAMQMREGAEPERGQR